MLRGGEKSMDSVMLVTGGSRGIGAAVARMGGERGYAVLINYRERADLAAQVVEAIRADGGRASAVQADVAIEADVDRLFAACDAEFGRPTVLVNNAGALGAAGAVAELSSEAFERVIAVNLTSVALCSRQAIVRMSKKDGGGAIVNVSSIAARLAYLPGLVAYAAAKAAVETLTIGLAREVGPLGIRVNAVRPGLIRTDMHEGRWDSFARTATTVPLEARPAEPEEVARAILWLASEEASYVSGAILDVTGGR